MTRDLFSQFSWGEFAVVAIFYSLMPFLSGARYGNLKGTLQLTAKIKSEWKRVLGIHIGFLSLLLGVFWESAQIYPSLPIWLTGQPIAKRLSSLDVIVCIAVILMENLEERWILRLKPSAGAPPGV